MPRSCGTTALLGREPERAELYDALTLALQGSPQVVVVAGDAGIGKTSLVSDLARRAEELGFSVAVGHGLDIEAGISFAPVVEAVRTLVTGAEGADSRPLARRMRTLLDPAAPRSTEQLHLLDDLRMTVLEAAAGGPVMLVLEDLHWADTSTRDLAVALSRTARGQLLLVLTVRTDDLHRRHPARKALAEVSRAPGGRRVELGPLDREGISGIVASITGSPADPATVRSVLERSEGNPLYAEEIAATGTAEIPGQLSDLFLARIDALAAGPRELVQMASVDGTQVDLDTLGDLAGLEQGPLGAFLHELVDANVLRAVGDSVQFRHGLLREAVHDDLLPGQRTRLHAELAAILQARVDTDPDPGVSVLSRLAFHWSSAQEVARALVASDRAGMAAWKIGAAESVTHLERALSMWERVPDAEVLVGRTQVEVVISLARAALDQGDGERWHALNRRAVEMLEPGTVPLVASRAYSALGLSAINTEQMSGGEEAVRLALEYAGDTASEERAYALAAQALLHLWRDQYAAALEVADRGMQAATSAAALDPLLLTTAFRSDALFALGRLSEARALWLEAIAVARSAGMAADAFDSSEHLALDLLYGGRITEGVAVARTAHRDALEAGLSVRAAYCGNPLVIALTWEGRPDAAEALLDQLIDLGLPDIRVLRRRTDLALLRGHVEATLEAMSGTRSDLEGVHPDDLDVLQDLQLAALCEDAARGLEVAGSYLGLLQGCDSPLIAATAARIGFQALTLVQPEPVPTEHVARIHDSATEQLARARGGLTDEWRGSFYGVQLALAEAYAARAARQPAVRLFREAAELAEPFGAFLALEARLDLAQELLAHGGRNEGRELLIDCWTAAHEIGAAGLERRAVRLATRSRVSLPGSGSNEGPLRRLTPREREVLDLLATGATNKTIAEALVISEKTASVHVSNVLGKLGVENRGAAAALARRLIG